MTRGFWYDHVIIRIQKEFFREQKNRDTTSCPLRGTAAQVGFLRPQVIDSPRDARKGRRYFFVKTEHIAGKQRIPGSCHEYLHAMRRCRANVYRSEERGIDKVKERDSEVTHETYTEIDKDGT